MDIAISCTARPKRMGRRCPYRTAGRSEGDQLVVRSANWLVRTVPAKPYTVTPKRFDHCFPKQWQSRIAPVVIVIDGLLGREAYASLASDVIDAPYCVRPLFPVFSRYVIGDVGTLQDGSRVGPSLRDLSKLSDVG